MIEKLVIVAILKDWKRGEAERNFNGTSRYPLTPIVEIELKLYSDEAVKKSIENSIKRHKDAVESGNLPLCSAKDRWATPDTYAVMEKGKKRAKRVLNSETEAQEYIDSNFVGQNSIYIEHRPGKNNRCMSYCNVYKFCDQENKG